MPRAPQASLVALALVLVAQVAEARPAKLTATLEAGGEYDTNINRVEPSDAEGAEAPRAAPLVRGSLSGRVAWRQSRNHALDLSFRGGVRVSLDERGREYDVGLVQLSAFQAYRTRAPVLLGPTVDYADVFERETRIPGATSADPDLSRDRDFRALGAGLQVIAVEAGGGRVIARLGYRVFTYKPDDEFSFHGEAAGVTYAARKEDIDAEGNVEAEYDLQLGYELSRRRYDANVLVDPCPAGQMPPRCFPERRADDRRDLFHTFRAMAAYTGPIAAKLEYELGFNDSNSYGQTLVRHVAALTLTKDLPRSVFATVRAELQLLSFLDPLIVNSDPSTQTFASIEDENRNQLLFSLDKALDSRDRVHGIVRWQLSSTGQFPIWRQLVFVGVSYAIE